MPARLGRVAAVLAATLLGGAVAAAVDQAGTPTAGDGSVLAALASSTPAPSGTLGSPRSPTTGLPTPVRRAADPTSATTGSRPLVVTVGSIGLRSTVRPVGVDKDGLMQIPTDVTTAGWYRHGSSPGEGAGATVLAAHVDTATSGKGPWAALTRVRIGSEVVVQTSAGAVRYRTTSVNRIRKSGLDTANLFSSTGPERLHLVTCGGRFDPSTGHYDQNVVVVAQRISTS